MRVGASAPCLLACSGGRDGRVRPFDGTAEAERHGRNAGPVRDIATAAL